MNDFFQTLFNFFMKSKIFGGPQSSLQPVRCADLPVDIVNVGFYGMSADPEFRSDILAAVA